jgi:putative glutamine amidotransferase
MRPLVGISTYVTGVRFSYWDLEAALIPSSYVDAIERAGARPLLVPPTTGGTQETLDALDALVLTGGPDIDPWLYGEEPHPQTYGIDRRRDDAELELLRGLLERDMPLLGICRGSQVINVGLGGDLHQHLPDVVGDGRHRHAAPGRFLDHDVSVTPRTRLAGLLGGRATVKSHHHQGLRRLGTGLAEAARADDGLIEAIEAPGHQFVLGALWHPEVSADTSLFEALAEEARRYHTRRQSAAEAHA